MNGTRLFYPRKYHQHGSMKLNKATRVQWLALTTLMSSDRSLWVPLQSIKSADSCNRPTYIHLEAGKISQQGSPREIKKHQGKKLVNKSFASNEASSGLSKKTTLLHTMRLPQSMFSVSALGTGFRFAGNKLQSNSASNKLLEARPQHQNGGTARFSTFCKSAFSDP